MSTPPFKATITITIEGPSPDEFGLALSNATDSLGFGSAGNGCTPNGTAYRYEIDSNLPSEPMTLDRLLKFMDDNMDNEDDRQLLRDTWGTAHLKDPNCPDRS
jgi:hypothetical protein